VTPALKPRYFAVTEQPGHKASAIQLEMLEARYSWAAEQARGKDVLEAACGAGMGLPVLAQVARSVEAGDVDAENLRSARAVCAGNPTISLREFHAGELPFARESFDLVLLFEAIYYLPDVREFFHQTQRVLRPGGALLIVTVNPEWSGFNPSPLKTRYWSAAELRQALQEDGFTARVLGAFPEGRGWIASAIRLVRGAAVALNLIPRTMRGKALLKRIFYGRLKAVPNQLASHGRSARLEELQGGPDDRRYRVLYATARKTTA
jgi:2-polyprenyl-3-methyl-5-hydroxy-6-metoxy-1,4-benzoquinol methylase